MTPLRSPTEAPRSDAELFARVAERDPRAAPAAQAELYERHVRYLWGVTRRLERRLLDLCGVSAEDLVQETFQRAFERASTFVEAPNADADRARARTRAWLGRIATNLLVDYANRVREVSASPMLDELPFEGVEEEEPARLAIVTGCLEELSEREQDVLRVTALHLRAGEHQRLPNAVSAELARAWQTTNENVRAVRSRALKKLRTCIERQEHA